MKGLLIFLVVWMFIGACASRRTTADDLDVEEHTETGLGADSGKPAETAVPGDDTGIGEVSED